MPKSCPFPMLPRQCRRMLRALAKAARLAPDIIHDLSERGTTVFLNSHLLSEVEQLCTEVAVISRGRVVAQGPVGGLLEGSGHKTRVRADNPQHALAVLSKLPSTQAELADDGLVEVEAVSMDAADINETLVKAAALIAALKG